MNSLHYQKIQKRVVTRIWDSLSSGEQHRVASEPDSEIAKWFNATVAAETKAKYESPDYWMNNPDSFRYAQRVAPLR